MKDPIKGSPYEKMKKRPGDDEKIERHFRTTQNQKRRIDTDESVTPMRSLAKKLIEMVKHGDKG
jgi:hypothetical protein